MPKYFQKGFTEKMREMVKFKKKAFNIKVLGIVAVFFFLMGLLSLNIIFADKTTAYADEEKIRISSENKGFFHSEDTDIDISTSLSMSFDIIYNVKNGDSFVGFGICKAEDAYSFADNYTTNESIAILFDTETTVAGDKNGVIPDYVCDKKDILLENYRYKVTFDNKEGAFILERKTIGPNAYSVIQKVSGFDSLSDGQYVIGLLYSENFDIVVSNLSFSVDEKIVEDAGNFSTKFNDENGNIVSDIVKTTAQESEKGIAYTQLTSDGIVCYSNESAISSSSGVVVISFTTSLFDLYSGEVGFAIGSKEKEDIIFTGSKGVCFTFSNDHGIKKYNSGNFTDYELIESELDINSIFSSNRTIKAVFDMNEGSFSLLVRFYEGSEFVEVLKIVNLDIYNSNVFAGLQFNASAKAKLVGLSIFDSRKLTDYVTSEKEHLHAEQRNISVKSNLDGTTTFNLKQDTYDSGSANEVIYTEHPINVGADESVILYIQDISEFEMENPEYQAKAGFIFSNTLNNPVQYMYSYNTNLTMFYENSRSVYWIREKGSENVQTQSLGSSIKFPDLFKKGNSLMAVFTPAHQSYSLYVKSAINPDFTLLQSFNIPSSSPVTINNTIYVGLELYYGMKMTVADYGVYKAKTEDVGIVPCGKNVFTGKGDAVKGGFVLQANAPAYITFSNINISDCDGVALEYGIESISNADGSYLLGFMITDGDKLPVAPFVENRKDKTEFKEEPGQYIEGTKSCLYAFVPPVGLTNDINGKIRDYIFHSGYKVRAVFSFTDKTTTIQYKEQTANSWNDIVVYNDLPDYLSTDKITVALRLQNTVKLSLSSLSAYKIKNANTSYQYVSDSATLIGDAQMHNIKVQSENTNAGNVYINEEGISELNILSDEFVQLNAVAKQGYIFTGWYVDEKLVSTDSEFSPDIIQTATYIAKFAPASRVVIKNGFKNYFTEVDKQFEVNKYCGINPQSVYGYEFIGWDISLYQNRADEKILLEKYYLSQNDSANNNMLNPYKDNLKIWKSLNNAFTVDGNCSIQTNETGTSYISFGKYIVIDKQGNDNGALIIKIPSLENEYNADGELIVENYVEITARYKEKDIIDSATFESQYNDTYNNNLKQTTKWAIIISVITLLCIGVLVLIKIYLIKKIDRR